MEIEQARVVEHTAFAGDYRILKLATPAVAAGVQPGQFVHLRVPELEIAVLRRPFSIYRADGATLSILYKQVGQGTQAMTRLAPGATVNLIGPLGNGFACDHADTVPLLVAGGYGVAPLSLLASRMAMRGSVFIGGATARDILCVADFETLGWEVHITTVDGSLGTRGLVTAALEAWLAAHTAGPEPEFYACGPDGMLRAVGEVARARGCRAWLSMDKHMGCGVGACLACVHRIRQADGTLAWERVCKDGPIFEAGVIDWDD